MARSGFKVIQIDGVNHRLYCTGTIKLILPLKSKFGEWPKVSCIYMVTNLLNGKRYIGSTVNMAKRVQRYVKSDLKKKVFEGCGFEDLKIEVLETCENMPMEKRLLKEYEYIRKYNTIYPEGNNMQCPVTQIRFSLLDLVTYDPLSCNYIYKKFPHTREKYLRSARGRSRHPEISSTLI